MIFRKISHEDTTLSLFISNCLRRQGRNLDHSKEKRNYDMRLWEQERKKHDKSGWENGDSNEVTTKRERWNRDTQRKRWKTTESGKEQNKLQPIFVQGKEPSKGSVLPQATVMVPRNLTWKCYVYIITLANGQEGVWILE